jgi:CrcB protein
MLWKSIVAICIGASLGALLRWGLSTRLNDLFPALPPGTLLANLLGAFVVGAAIAFFATAPSVSAEWRLLIITGFCGALTTFSAFSAELVDLLRQGQTAWALGAMAAHVTGSVLMTMAGIGLVGWLRS